MPTAKPPAPRSPSPTPRPADAKREQLDAHRVVSDGTHLSTNQGGAISDDHNSLTAGPRGPTLLEDFVYREKMTHFDHERIPERVVHARGSGAHGEEKGEIP